MTDPERIPSGYRLIRSIGRGNTSQVYLATTQEGREVALKLPHPETVKVHESAERFGNEVRLTLKFRHPHIVQGFGGTPFGQQAFLAIQYFPLGALSEQLVLRQGRKLELPEALRILADIAGALAYLHKNGAVHQDVKTQNVYVNPQGRAALGDLGNTYFMAQGGKVSGSPYYMAPEIYHGENSSSASDVYSLAVMMYELLTGQRPFSGGSYEELMVAHLTRFPTPLSHLSPLVPRPVSRLVEQGIAKRPQDRPSADSIYRALLDALGEKPDDEEEEEAHTPATYQPGRHGTAPRGATPPGSPPATPSSEPKKSSRGWNPFKKKS
ncbi:serine/threonine-protein kinase [Deinococcus fonticola]|uniref:serine/threonine-protein kinase n=1 Tax=Deinococcus fonticola TaxID=2528713 RepID=UPI0010752AC5|nr:serine/threonine-protein kinase [Deinococcus fonticola]